MQKIKNLTKVQRLRVYMRKIICDFVCPPNATWLFSYSEAFLIITCPVEPSMFAAIISWTINQTLVEQMDPQ